jgi:hypothetical protein
MGRIIIALSLEVILLSLSIQTGELLQMNGYFNDDIVVMLEINYKINFAITMFLSVYINYMLCMMWRS